MNKYKLYLRVTYIAACLMLWLRISPTKLEQISHVREGLFFSSLRVLKNLNKKAKNSKQKPLSKVGIFTVQGMHNPILGLDLAIATQLQANNIGVHAVLCDKALPICTNKRAGEESKWKRRCDVCFARGSLAFEIAGIKPTLLSELAKTSSLMSPTNKLEISKKIKPIINQAILKSFKKGRVTEAEKDKYFSLHQRSSEIISLATEKLYILDVKNLFMSHGVYVEWGVALLTWEYISSKRSYVYNFGKRKKSAWFNWSHYPYDLNTTYYWEHYKNGELSEDDKELILTYLSTRRNHSEDEHVYNFGSVQSENDLKRELEIDDPNKKVFVLFTNVLWDAAAVERDSIFEDPIEWVLETINWFAKNSSDYLVIKIHPSEVVIGTEQPFFDVIQEHFGQLPPHIRIIEPHVKVNVDSFYKICDVGLVYTSTPGLELALRGIAVLVLGSVHYAAKGFTVEVNSKVEYFQLLKDPLSIQNKLKREKVMRLALLYSFVFFEKYHKKLDMFNPSISGYALSDTIDYNAGVVSQLASDISKNLECDNAEKIT